jgi:glucosamine kinase
MMLIIDSGSTKSDWVFLSGEGNIQAEFHLMGFNPLFHSSKFIVNELDKFPSLRDFTGKISRVYFYGAGCSAPVYNDIIRQALMAFYPQADISVSHDVLAAAYATFSGVPGISCILGTGSNCVFFDGVRITENTPSLGYILGDEASGSYFGKKMLRAFLYRQLPENIARAFADEYNPDKAAIIHSVYREPGANVYLARYTKFMYGVKEDPFIHKVLVEGMRHFLETHVCSFSAYERWPVHFTGSVAYYFQEALKEAASDLQLHVGKIVKSPMRGLIAYHSGKH